MKKKSHPIGSALSRIQIPTDLAYQESVITFWGKREVCVENYRRICEYCSGRIVLLLKSGKLCISGTNLNITYYSKEEMKISGQIQQITFEP